jgi:RNA polymerase sporulation-specific sigma factor
MPFCPAEATVLPPVDRAPVALAPLAAANVRLMHMVLRRYRRLATLRAVETCDLENAALLALHEAALLYRPERGRFSTLAFLHMRRAVVQVLRARSRRPWRQLPATDTGEELPVADAHGQAPDARLRDEDNQQTVARLLNALTDRERLVVELFYGLRDGRERTRGEVASLLGVSKTRIGQLLDRGPRRARRHAGQEGITTSPARDTGCSTGAAG